MEFYLVLKGGAGLRMRFPKSLLVGLMWLDAQNPDALTRIRHWAQERDGAAHHPSHSFQLCLLPLSCFC